ncbi:hypothetical protein BN2476_110213 [Paraburkholderia piptadeniae]|uniref:Uncharacterized protein n=1 Tax=Paraburkholderia piptadeniae TaxID=1701573 RepID=A0A1N7RQE7_9BURK|nr:hypothetical protein BN2476_110213 [Paraburkholderia piptadeniae]
MFENGNYYRLWALCLSSIFPAEEIISRKNYLTFMKEKRVKSPPSLAGQASERHISFHSPNLDLQYCH